jgi:HK97 family phage major capsid protein
MRSILELQERRGAIAEDLMDMAEKTMTAAQRREFDNLLEESDQLKRQLDALSLDGELRQRNKPPRGRVGNDDEGWSQPAYVEDPAYKKSFRSYLRTGEKRDLALSTATESLPTSVLVPQAFSAEIESAMKYYGPMLQVCRMHSTPTGAPLPWPTSDDTDAVAEIVGEGLQVGSDDPGISAITFGAFKYSTKLVKVSLELLQDSNFPLESWLAEQFGKRLGRKLNTDFTTGAGTTLPFGIVTKATAGPTATGSGDNTGGSETGTDTIGTADLVALEHSVDPAYRVNAAYMANDDTIKYLKSLLDKYGRPIFEVSENGKLTTINGYPLYPNNDLATLATGAKTMLFGDFSKYVCRKVRDLSILRLTERFADYGQVAFIGFARYDGNLLDAGTHPVKYLVQA